MYEIFTIVTRSLRKIKQEGFTLAHEPLAVTTEQHKDVWQRWGNKAVCLVVARKQEERRGRSQDAPFQDIPSNLFLQLGSTSCLSPPRNNAIIYNINNLLGCNV